MVRVSVQDRGGKAQGGPLEHSGTVIAGGFVLVPVASLMATWRACRSRPLGVGDFRAWLAASEMIARRGNAEIRPAVDGRYRPAGRISNYRVGELARLMGVAEKRARASVRRLVEAGLVEWSEGAIEFPDHILNVDEVVADSIGGGRGSVAIPRRMLRFLAAGARPAVIATALGVLLRCLSRRKGGFQGRGRVKASWIARTFKVSLRQAKAARGQVVELGWIEPLTSDAWAERRWGRAYQLDLGWVAPGPAKSAEATCVPGLGGPTSSPLPADSGPTSSPPDLQTRTPFGREKNQDPDSIELAGVKFQGQGEGTPTAKGHPPILLPLCCPLAPPHLDGVEVHQQGAETPTTPSNRPIVRLFCAHVPPPRLDDLRAPDLRDAAKLIALHRQAVARKLADDSEAGLIQFAALAEHAAAVGKVNPAGLFAYLLRGCCWRYITQADEDEARRRLKACCGSSRAPDVAGGSMARALAAPTISEDARLVREVRAASIRAGIYRDPWPAFSAKVAVWDRARWDAALAELGLC